MVSWTVTVKIDFLISNNPITQPQQLMKDFLQHFWRIWLPLNPTTQPNEPSPFRVFPIYIYIFISLLFTLQSCSESTEVANNKIFIAKKIIHKKNDVVQENYLLIDNTGKELTNANYRRIQTVVEPENYFIADKNEGIQFFEITSEELLFNKTFQEARAFSREGFARVKIEDKWGFIDNTGSFIVPPLYDVVGPFSEGLASVLIESNVGFINREGKVVIDPKFDLPDGWNIKENLIQLYKFRDGMSPAIINGNYGYIDCEGQFIIPPTFSTASEFISGRAAVSISNKQSGSMPYSSENDLYGIIDESGGWIVEPKFSNIFLDEDYFIGAQYKPISSYFEKEAFSYYYYSGKKMIEKEFEVRWDDGFVLSSGNPLYRSTFSEELAFVCLNDSCGYIDQNGNNVDAFKFFPTISGRELFVNGLAAVAFNANRNEGQLGQLNKITSYRPVGIIDRSGDIVVPPVFIDAQIYNAGIIKVIPKDLTQIINFDKAFYIDYKGNYLWNGYSKEQ